MSVVFICLPILRVRIPKIITDILDYLVVDLVSSSEELIGLQMTTKSVDEHLLALRARQDAALLRARNARTAVSRFERQMAALSRRQTTQRLCTLGRAWLALGDASPNFQSVGQRFLNSYISRETDRDILRGTPWEISDVPAPDEAPDHD
ncbi:hypothetical protein [Acidisoma cladoniae]|jgi:chromosome condensin MukBEF MukE localization factor|uniref:hypothetical protein n=1 Tax=Acidisoma cladoniae TaxID=3040935 RepID=UPI00254CE556|nr:hypothetical protein [Acidisoma sp. PAMC 29798]